MKPEIDHKNTIEIVCPYCGHVHGDSWEANDSGELECWNEECGKKFFYERNVWVTYSTTEVKQ